MNPSKKLPFNLRGVAIGVGVGAALSISNGPAVGVSIGAALAVGFGLALNRRVRHCP
jgi:hypothetical protein